MDIIKFLEKYRSQIILAGFSIYLLLLLIGLIAEIFEIQSILNWWIWSPPGSV